MLSWGTQALELKAMEQELKSGAFFFVDGNDIENYFGGLMVFLIPQPSWTFRHGTTDFQVRDSL